MNRWRDASGNPSAAFPEPSPSHSSTPLGSIYEGLSPTFSNNNDIPWEIPDAAWADASSPVHSPGWPSPRGANGGFMFLPAAAVKLSGSPRAQDVATPTPTYGFSTPPPSPPPPTPTSLPPLSLKDRGLNPAASRDGELKLEHKAGKCLRASKNGGNVDALRRPYATFRTQCNVILHVHRTREDYLYIEAT